MAKVVVFQVTSHFVKDNWIEGNKNGTNNGGAIYLVKDSFRVLESQKQVEKDGLHRVLEFGHCQTLKQLKRAEKKLKRFDSAIDGAMTGKF